MWNVAVALLAAMIVMGAGCSKKGDAEAPAEKPAAKAESSASPAAEPKKPAVVDAAPKNDAPKEAEAPPKPGSIDGKVRLNGELKTPRTNLTIGDKGAMGGVGVELWIGGKKVDSAVTSARGKFKFDEVPAGKHELRLTHPRLPTITKEVDVTGGAMSIVGLGYHADQLEAAGDEPAGATP